MLTAVCLCCLLDYFERLRVIVHHINYINNHFITCFNYACWVQGNNTCIYIANIQSVRWILYIQQSRDVFFFWSLVGSAWIHISCWLIRRTCALVVMTTHPHQFTRLQTVYLLHASDVYVSSVSRSMRCLNSGKLCSALHG